MLPLSRNQRRLLWIALTVTLFIVLWATGVVHVGAPRAIAATHSRALLEMT